MAVVQLNKKGQFVIPGLGFIHIPTHITRRKNHDAWELRYDGDIYSFIDWEYGDSIESLRAAVATFEELVEHPMQKPARVRMKESCSKQQVTGTAGVYYYATQKERGFMVRNIRGETDRVKIHGEGKVAEKAALRIAEMFRQEFISAYRALHGFDLTALKEKLGLA